MSYAAAASDNRLEVQSAGDYVHVVVKPLTPVLGAEIAGVDLSRPLSGAVFEEIGRAFVELSSSATRS